MIARVRLEAALERIGESPAVFRLPCRCLHSRCAAAKMIDRSLVQEDEKRVVVGWAEYVELPDWKIRRLRAKMDSGARNSALHVENIREVGQDRVRFDVRLHRRNADRRVTVETTIKRRGRVRASSGQAEQRIFVTACVRIGSHEQEVELSLVDREKMIFRMLIGRSALAQRYLVDAGRRYLLSKSRSSTKKTAK